MQARNFGEVIISERVAECKDASNMTTQLTQDLIKQHGWTYMPEHDGLTGKDKMVETTIPESWIHEQHGVAWSIDEVLDYVNDDIELEIESNLR